MSSYTEQDSFAETQQIFYDAIAQQHMKKCILPSELIRSAPTPVFFPVISSDPGGYWIQLHRTFALK